MNRADDCSSELQERIQALSRPLQPEATDIDDDCRPIEGIRAVLFDIYGTLFISGAGDISIGNVDSDESIACAALTAAGWPLDPGSGSQPITRLLEAAIARAHEHRKRAGIEYPEVDILAIWANVLKGLSGNLSGPAMVENRLRRLAVDYEFQVNPVWPMPGLRQTLAALREQGMVMGLVSNAQFYTPLMFHALLGETLSQLGFDPSCCAFSYQMLEAKPSVRLYQHALEAVHRQHGIRPDQILYIGNDRLNDIWPAGRVGCRTVLFAGDRRSLRLREQDKRCAAVQPERIVCDLRQLKDIVVAG